MQDAAHPERVKLLVSSGLRTVEVSGQVRNVAGKNQFVPDRPQEAMFTPATPTQMRMELKNGRKVWCVGE